MSTPPPSNVGPPKGYTTDTDSMSAQSKAINDAAEDAEKDVKDVDPTKVTDKDFGTVHTQWQKDYAAGIEQLGKGADAMCANLKSFAGKIGAAGTSYASNESSQTAAVNQSGSGA